VLLEHTAGGLVTRQDRFGYQCRAQEDDYRIFSKISRELVSDNGIVIQFREGFVGRPVLAVFVELRLPAVGDFRGNLGAVDKYKFAVELFRHLLGLVLLQRHRDVHLLRQLFQYFDGLGNVR
jgi:hypothetical protein